MLYAPLHCDGARHGTRADVWRDCLASGIRRRCYASVGLPRRLFRYFSILLLMRDTPTLRASLCRPRGARPHMPAYACRAELRCCHVYFARRLLSPDATLMLMSVEIMLMRFHVMRHAMEITSPLFAAITIMMRRHHVRRALPRFMPRRRRCLLACACSAAAAIRRCMLRMHYAFIVDTYHQHVDARCLQRLINNIHAAALLLPALIAMPAAPLFLSLTPSTFISR